MQRMSVGKWYSGSIVKLHWYTSRRYCFARTGLWQTYYTFNGKERIIKFLSHRLFYESFNRPIRKYSHVRDIGYCLSGMAQENKPWIKDLLISITLLVLLWEFHAFFTVLNNQHASRPINGAVHVLQTSTQQSTGWKLACLNWFSIGYCFLMRWVTFQVG